MHTGCSLAFDFVSLEINPTGAGVTSTPRLEDSKGWVCPARS